MIMKGRRKRVDIKDLTGRPKMKKMLINSSSPEEIRVALVEDGVLQDFSIDILSKGQIQGNIYKGKVVRIEPRINAAFIDFGGQRNGFLPIDEIDMRWSRKREMDESESRPRIKDILSKGQELLVQVIQEERGTKGPMLTTYVSLPGRYLVIMPFQSQIGVSKKIEDDKERERLKKIISEVNAGQDIGCIVRTAGEGRSKGELSREYKYLVRIWNKIWDQFIKASTPSLLFQESNLAIRTIRDYFSPDIEEIVCDNPDIYVSIKDFFNMVSIRSSKIVKLYKDRLPIFDHYQIEDQIESIYNHRVELQSGGTIVIDPTEALVAIDVNTGKTQVRGDAEEIAFMTNMEAAREIARQLRLRDLGGLIVIDFIDMKEKRKNSEVERCLREAFRRDKAKVKFSKISRFGLLEMSRERLRPSIQWRSYIPCPNCNGKGMVKTVESQALHVLRKIQRAIYDQPVKQVLVKVAGECASYMLNEKREALLSLERENNVKITVKGEDGYSGESIEIRCQ